MLLLRDLPIMLLCQREAPVFCAVVAISVEVCYPHQHHGNARRPSNSSKPRVREDFLNFVDCNVQPNGRSVDSSGPTRYFVSTFTTIQVPKKGVANFEERKARSVVEFNQIQEENGKQGCSNGSASN